MAGAGAAIFALTKNVAQSQDAIGKFAGLAEAQFIARSAQHNQGQPLPLFVLKHSREAVVCLDNIAGFARQDFVWRDQKAVCIA